MKKVVKLTESDLLRIIQKILNEGEETSSPEPPLGLQNTTNVSNEKSELTEKCWKGYTQKGMKTMFGKRYPNCVKKK